MEAAVTSLAGFGFVAVLEPSFAGEIAAGFYATYFIIQYGPDVVEAAMDLTQSMIDNISKDGRGNIWPDSYPKPNIPDIDWSLRDSQLATNVIVGGAPPVRHLLAN